MSIAVPLSLQDSCKLKVISCIDSYPMNWLCKLPLSIKKKLFKILPIFDRLHFENTAFCDGLEDLEESTETNPETYVTRHLKGSNDDMKQQIITSLFKTIKYDTTLIIEGCRLNFESSLSSLDCLSSPTAAGKDRKQICNDLVNHISVVSSNFVSPLPKCYKELLYNDGFDVPTPLVLIPKRFTADFFDIDAQQFSIEITFKNLKNFIDYCNAQTTTVGNVFSVDLIDLVQSHIWDTYKIMQRETMVGGRVYDLFKPTCVPFNPVCPFIQDMLSSVEVVEVGTGDRFEPDLINEEEVSIEAPYFILHNLISSKNPILKSVKVHGIPTTVTGIIDTLAGFLCKEYTSTGTQHLYTDDGNEFSLVVSSDIPYNGVESISFICSNGDYDYTRQYMTSNDSDEMSIISSSVIENQISSIKNFSINGLGFLYEEIDTSSERMESSSVNWEDLKIVNSEGYRSLLERSLVQLVQSPQFCSLTVDDAPDKNCHDLVSAFLCVPTSHEQKLSISLREEKPSILGYFKNALIPEDLPETNLQFKSLHLGKNISQLAQHIVHFPYLILKRLSISASNLSTATSKINIASVHLYIKCKQRKSVPIEADKLDLFICQNPSLTSLTFSFSDYYRGQERPPSLFFVINSCLKKLLGKNQLLSEIELNGVRFSQFRGTDDHDLVPRHASVVQPSSFSFSSNQQTTTSCINVPASVHDKDLYVFFMLLQRLGVTLTFSGCVFAGNLVLDVIPALETTFGAESTKINKIVLKAMSRSTGLEEITATFEKIAKTVLVV